MRRLITTLLYLCIVLAVSAVALGTVFLQDQPLVERADAPSTADVAATRLMVYRFRNATGTLNDGREIRVSADDLNSALRLGARVFPSIRTEVAITDSNLSASLSLPVRWPKRQKWLNVKLWVPAFDGTLRFSSVKIGQRNLPPDLALRISRIGSNLFLGHQAGGKIIDSIEGMRIKDDKTYWSVKLNSEQRDDVIGSLFGALRNETMPSPEKIDGYYRMIRQALDDGTLPAKGSLAPHLRFTLQAAHATATDETAPDEYTAAIFGLTKACGARDFADMVGRLTSGAAPDFGDWRVGCDKVTLAGRVDSRLHFVTAAAIKAAGNRGLAVSMGEFKELFDQRQGGSDFDFTDIAADNSGVRLSDLFMSAPLADWPVLIARITGEDAVLASYDGLPAPIPEPDFKARFGDVNSAAYRAMIDDIETRIDRTALYATRSDD